MKGNDIPINELIDTKALGQSLKNARIEKNYTQDAVARATGIKRRSHIADIEAGRYMPSVATLIKMAVALDYDLNCAKEFIVTEIQQPEPNRRVFMRKYNKTKTEIAP